MPAHHELKGKTGAHGAPTALPSTIEQFGGPGEIVGIEVEAVVGGALMRLSFSAGTNPADVASIVRGFDANAKFRDDFPRGGFGGGGKRDTKVARVVSISVEVRDSGKFIDMIATGADDDLKVAVPKKAVDEWLPKLKALGKLDARKIAKIEAAFEKKGGATISLTEAEQFGAAYFEHDGKAYLDAMQPDAPALADGGAA